MSFYNGDFSFNGITSKDMNVHLVSLNDDILMDYGLTYKKSLQVESSRINKFYYQGEDEVDTITINLALADKDNKPMDWTLEQRRKVLDWFVADDFCEFISADDKSICYYLKCIGYTKKFNPQGYGVIEFVMQPENQYGNTPIIEYVYHVKGEQEFTIECLDNVDKRYYPKLDVIQFNEGKKDISIKNLSTNEDELLIKNLLYEEKLEIDNLLKSVYSNKEKYRLKDLNRKWFYIKKGLNKIKVIGDCDIKITAQYKLKV